MACLKAEGGCWVLGGEAGHGKGLAEGAAGRVLVRRTLADCRGMGLLLGNSLPGPTSRDYLGAGAHASVPGTL